MRRSVALVAVIVVAVLALAACSSSGSSLTGKSWQWTASTTKAPASESVVPNPEKCTIEFKSDGTFSA
jgi:ABC-type glycerol-3-phosphate transport system substrate-binding protein